MNTMRKIGLFITWLFTAVFAAIGGVLGLIGFLIVSPFVAVFVTARVMFSVCGELFDDALSVFLSRIKKREPDDAA